MIRALIFLTLIASPAIATDAVGNRLGVFVEGCRIALTSADTSPFATLDIESEMESDTVSVFGWRDGVTGASVSLLYKGKSKSKGICDISYVSDPDGVSESEEMDRLRISLATNTMQGAHVIENSMSGPVILHCYGKQGLALFLDPSAVGKGFAAQISTIEKARMDIDCEGET